MGSERVAIVNATMAETMWPNADPIGKCLQPFADSVPCARIVGVAENTHRNKLREEPTMHYYIPLGQEIGFGGPTLLVRGAGDPHALFPELRKRLLRADASIQYLNAATVQEQIDPQSRPWRLGAVVFAISGLLALLVAAVGIYSVISYLIADRQREIGVRIALGAQAADISSLVLRGSLLMAVFGVAIGELLALSASRFVEPMLFDTSARDVSVYAGVGVLLIAVAFVATALPALRAGRIDPLDALRTE
ncbi:MAG: FtsX-like permease family protein [Gemmatimonadaceae bacterium]